MVVPLLLGAAINTIDQLHLNFITNGLKFLGAPKTEEGHYEMLQIGGFSRIYLKIARSF